MEGRFRDRFDAVVSQVELPQVCQLFQGGPIDGFQAVVGELPKIQKEDQLLNSFRPRRFYLQSMESIDKIPAIALDDTNRVVSQRQGMQRGQIEHPVLGHGRQAIVIQLSVNGTIIHISQLRVL